MIFRTIGHNYLADPTTRRDGDKIKRQVLMFHG